MVNATIALFLGQGHLRSVSQALGWDSDQRWLSGVSAVGAWPAELANAFDPAGAGPGGSLGGANPLAVETCRLRGILTSPVFVNAVTCHFNGQHPDVSGSTCFDPMDAYNRRAIPPRPRPRPIRGIAESGNGLQRCHQIVIPIADVI
jgi:hypothetical protein